MTTPTRCFFGIVCMFDAPEQLKARFETGTFYKIFYIDVQGEKKYGMLLSNRNVFLQIHLIGSSEKSFMKKVSSIQIIAQCGRIPIFSLGIKV